MAEQREITLSLPEPVVQAAMARESWTIGELVEDVLTQRERTVRWRELTVAAQERAAANGYTEEDVDRLIAEYRQDQAEGR